MRITRLTVERVKNLGNCESQRLQAEGTLDEYDEPGEAHFSLLQFVEDQLGLQAGRRATPPVEAPPPALTESPRD